MQLLTVSEVAELLGVKPSAIYYWTARNEIPFIKVGKHLRFYEEEVIEHFIQKTREKKALASPLFDLLPVAVSSVTTGKKSLAPRTKE